MKKRIAEAINFYIKNVRTKKKINNIPIKIIPCILLRGQPTWNQVALAFDIIIVLTNSSRDSPIAMHSAYDVSSYVINLYDDKLSNKYSCIIIL